MFNTAINYTDEELLTLVYNDPNATPLELELALRLESLVIELEGEVLEQKKPESRHVTDCI